MDKLKVFVSYAHEDAHHKNELLKHCALFVENEKLALWTDDSIRAGNKFDNKIKEELETCQIAILLLSSTYWSKDYIRNNELPSILEHEKNRDITIVPILINGERKVKHTALNNRTLIPTENNTLKAIEDFINKEKAWDIVFDEIDKSLEEYEEKEIQKEKTIIEEEPIEEGKKLPKICIYVASPLNNMIHYQIGEIINTFKNYNVELFNKALNEDNLLEHYEYDYNLIITNVNNTKFIIENDSFMQKSIDVDTLKEIQNLTLFLNKNINKTENEILVDAKSLRKALLSFAYRNFKDIKGKYKLNPFFTELPDLIDIKNLNNFVGREIDLEIIIKKILTVKEEYKILTIKGAGGLGKTTIITKAIVEFSKRGKFEDGIKFVQCEYIKDYEDFENKITFAFDMNNAINFKEQLKNRDTNRLIVLDNVETLLHIEDTNKIKELIRFISDYATIVITSREILNENEYEEVHELKEFSTDESEELFVNLYFKKKKYNKKQLRIEILENFLNNNPLAITIVANNLSKSKNTQQIKKELEDNFNEITTKDIAKMYVKESDLNIERTASLFHSINYSYKKLSLKEKLALETLSLFPDGIHFDNFKKFYNQKQPNDKKNKKTIKHKLENFSDRDIKSLEDKSLIINSNQFINLQSIIGRFADFNFNKRDEVDKIKFYERAYLYNEYTIKVIQDVIKTGSKQALIFDNLKNNFIKSFEFLKYLTFNENKLFYLDDIVSQFSSSASPSKKIFKKLEALKKVKKENELIEKNFEVLYLILKYFYGEFDDVFNLIKKEYPITKYDNNCDNISRLEVILMRNIFTIYEMEGYSLEALRVYLKRVELHSSVLVNLGEYKIVNAYFVSNIRIVDNLFFYYELLLNQNVLDIKELVKYIKSIYKTQIIEKVQASYTLLKADKKKVTLKSINDLVVSNPFTDGLKILMLAIKDERNCSKHMFEEAIYKLTHIKYYHVEAILIYSKYLKNKRDSDYIEWFKKGKDLAEKHHYRYLQHQFNCLDSNVYSDYDEDNYPLPEKIDYSKVAKKYNLTV